MTRRDDDDVFLPNGLDARTGRPAWQPVRAEELDELAALETGILPAPPPAPEPAPEPTRGLRDAEAADLATSGWAMLVPEGGDPEILQALDPLDRLRQRQAKRLYRSPIEVPRGETFESFLAARPTLSPLEVDPRVLPYYLLIVGSPEEISYDLQQRLAQGRAVGRLHLGTLADYRAYADNVVAAEERPRYDRPEVGWFAADNGDEVTRRTREELVEPLSTDLGERRQSWRRRVRSGDEATKEALGELLRASPHLLFTATHGVKSFSSEDDQEEIQGALITSDWREDGSRREWGWECYLTEQDLPDELGFDGGIAFLFACFSGGTPETDGYWFKPRKNPDGSKTSFTSPQRLAARPFVSRLVQGLLSRPRGPLAVIAHVDRAWTSSFSWSAAGQVGAYRDTLLHLMDGHRAGHAAQYLWAVHRVAAAALHHGNDCRAAGLPFDRGQRVRYWLAANDARNFVVCGDPAARLPIA